MHSQSTKNMIRVLKESFSGLRFYNFDKFSSEQITTWYEEAGREKKLPEDLEELVAEANEGKEANPDHREDFDDLIGSALGSQSE